MAKPGQSPLRRVWGRIVEFFTTALSPWPVPGRMVWTRWSRGFRSWFAPTQDWGRPDYDFWRRAYYCRVKGLEVSGLFLKPLVGKVAAWTLGRPPGWTTGNEAADDALTTWWATAHADILRAYRHALRQGDVFLVFNADGTLTLVPPELVEPLVAEDDFGRIIGWRITQVLTHPEEFTRMRVIDEYTVERRVHRVETESGQPAEQTFSNPLGVLPVVHIANGRDDGEIFGHAEAEPLLPTLHRYGQLFEAAIEGNILQGRPTPVISFSSRQDLQQFNATYAVTRTRTLPNGTSEPYTEYDIDLSQLLALSGATFSYESPGSFSQDTERLLGLMFYLILEHTEIPEFVFGNAIASSQASAETQMPVFEKFIEMRRTEVTGWLTQLAVIALRWLALTTPGVGVSGPPTIQWQKLTQNGTLTLETIQWALTEGLLDERTALMLAPVDVQDVDGVLDAARQEREERQQQAVDPIQREFDEELESEMEEP